MLRISFQSGGDAHLQRVYEQCISRGASVSYKGLTRDHSKLDVAAHSSIQGVTGRHCQLSVPCSPDAAVSGDLTATIYQRAGGDYKPRTQYPSETTETLHADRTHSDRSDTRRYVRGPGFFPRHSSTLPTPLQGRLFGVRMSKEDQICWDCSRWTC
jgi:hypothetical protein